MFDVSLIFYGDLTLNFISRFTIASKSHLDWIVNVSIVGSDSQPSKPAIFNTCLDGFECIQYKECIPAANVCDGYMDCDDRSDEINCGSY